MERAARRTGLALLSVTEPAIEFERAIVDAVAVTGDALTDVGKEKQLRDLTDDFLAMGVTSKEVADSIGFMGMAGLQTNDILTAMPTAMDLAKASSISAARAIDLGTDVMTSFGLKAGELARVNDVLTQTFTDTNTTLPLTARSLFKIGPLATQAGVSIESVAGAVGVLASAGIKGGESGTALRNVFLRLAKPTKDVKSAFKTLRVNIKDVQKALAEDDLSKAFTLIGKGAENLSSTKRLKVFGQLFGTRAAAAGAFLTEQAGTGGLARQTARVQASEGITGRIAAKKLESDAAKFDAAKARLKELAVVAGKQVVPALIPIAEGLLDFLEPMAKFAKDNPVFVTGLAKALLGLTALTAVMGPVVTTVGGLTRAAALLQTGLGGGGLAGAVGNVGGSSTTAVSGLGKLGRAMGAAGLLGAVAGLSVGLGAAADQMFGISNFLAGVGLGTDEQGRQLAKKRGTERLSASEIRRVERAEAAVKEAEAAPLVLEKGVPTGIALSRAEAQQQINIRGAKADADRVRREVLKTAGKRGVGLTERFTGRAQAISAEEEDIARLSATTETTRGRRKKLGIQEEVLRRRQRLEETTRGVEQEAETRGFRSQLGEIDPRFKLRVVVDHQNETVKVMGPDNQELSPSAGETVVGMS